METKNIMIVGVGGQGTLLASKLLGRLLLGKGYDVKVSEVHGMSQRGGDVMSCLRLSSSPIASDLIPQGKADLVVSLEPMEALRYIQWLSPQGWIVTNTVPMVNITSYPPMEDITGALDATGRVVSFDMDEVAKEVASARASNMVLLGAAAPMIDIPVDKIENAIREVFGAKGERIVENNLMAFRAGLEKAKAIINR